MFVCITPGIKTPIATGAIWIGRRVIAVLGEERHQRVGAMEQSHFEAKMV